MALDTQQLITNSRCYDCGIPEGMRLSVLIYQLTLLTGVTDIQTLINNARCYDCGISPGMQLAVLISQFDAWGGGGGGSQIQAFYLEPGDDPTIIGLVPTGGAWGSGPGLAGVAYNLDGDFWTYSDGAWVKIISA